MSNQTEEKPAGIGDNQPPLDQRLAVDHDEIIAKIEPLAERANALPKQITNQEELDQVSPVVIDARGVSKELDKARTAAKKPFLDGGRTVDGFFRPLIQRVDRIVGVFEGLATDYQRALQRQQAEEARAAKEAAAKRERESQDKAAKAKRASTQEKHSAAAEEAREAALQAEADQKAREAELAKTTVAGGTAKFTKFWDYKIEDGAQVDLNDIRDFLKPDDIERAIRAKIKIQKGATKIGGVTVFENVKTAIR